MDRAAALLFTDLRFLIAELGQHGGLISPSIYDTAQVLRLAPPAAGHRETLDWLLEQQEPDGGWGDPAVPRARDVPTLATVLTLHAYREQYSTHDAVKAGLDFLRQNAHHWGGSLPEDLPVGVELLLPYLLDEAARAGLELPLAPYHSLVALGQRRRQLISRISLRPGTTPPHSWEAFGQEPDPALIDGSGGLGHSPAATAAWVSAAAGRPELAGPVARARRYLEQAAAATGAGVAGLYPTVWPITRFEQSNALYALHVGGVLQLAELADVVGPQLADLARAMTPDGLGMSDHFTPDGDDTAEALAVLREHGFPTQIQALQRFAQDQVYCAYHGELQMSLTVTAHAVHALAIHSLPCQNVVSTLLDHRGPDGLWPGDKWNGSWIYTTTQILIALAVAGPPEEISATVAALVAHQRPDGGWGVRGSTREETAYVALALIAVARRHPLDDVARRALARARAWLLATYKPLSRGDLHRWLGKELYRPYRLADAIELAATLSLLLRGNRR